MFDIGDEIFILSRWEMFDGFNKDIVKQGIHIVLHIDTCSGRYAFDNNYYALTVLSGTLLVSDERGIKWMFHNRVLKKIMFFLDGLNV